MSKTSIFLFLIFTLTACHSEKTSEVNFSSTPTLVGKWRVTDYQNEILVKLSEKESKGLESSIHLLRREMKEFSEYTFNADSSYYLNHAPGKFDKGQWMILQDSILVQNSWVFETSDSSIIHFSDTSNAVIEMRSTSQKISVSIHKE